MLETLRRHSQSYLVYLFFGIIIVVFVFFFGPQSRGCEPGRAVTVAEVGPVEITSLQLDQLFARVDLYERNLPEEQRIPPPVRRRQLAEDLVLTRLLADEARAAGMAISDEQFGAYIRDPSRNPDFRDYADRTGEFDYQQYELRVPGMYGMALEEYEAWKENELLARGLLELLTEAVTVTESEVEALHRLRNTRYDLEFIRFDPAELTELFAVSDAEVAAALESDRERIEAFYEAHREEFEQPRTMRVRRIFIRLPSESDVDRRAEALERYQTALELVTSDPDNFAEVAREYSQSTDAEDGGDMGLKPAEAYRSYPFLEERLDDIELGAIETYESAVSRIIFRVEEDHPAEIPEFEAIQEDVTRRVLEGERGEAPVLLLAQWFLERAQPGLTLEEVALEHARIVAETGLQPRPGSPGSEEESDTEGPSPTEGEEPETPTSTEREEAEQAEAETAEDTEAAEDAEDAETAEDAEPLEPLVEVSRTGLFALDDPGMDLSQFGPQFAGQTSPPRSPNRIPRIGEVPALARQVAHLTEEAPVAPEVYREGDAFIVARLAERQPAAEEVDEDTYEELRDAIWRDKTRTLFGSWERRLIYHEPAPLGLLLRDRLDHAQQEGDVRFNEAYFTEREAEPPPE